MRIPNNEIWTNFPGVCNAIDQIVQERIDPQPSTGG